MALELNYPKLDNITKTNIFKKYKKYKKVMYVCLLNGSGSRHPPIKMKEVINNLSKTIVIKTSAEDNSTSKITIEEAISSLSGYWNIDTIKPMLLNGSMLWTPYYQYKIETK